MTDERERYRFENGIHFFDVTGIMTDEEYKNWGMGIVDLAQKVHKECWNEEKSKTQLRKDIAQGAFKLNDVKITDINCRFAIDKTVFNDKDVPIIIYRD